MQTNNINGKGASTVFRKDARTGVNNRKSNAWDNMRQHEGQNETSPHAPGDKEAAETILSTKGIRQAAGCYSSAAQKMQAQGSKSLTISTLRGTQQWWLVNRKGREEKPCMGIGGPERHQNVPPYGCYEGTDRHYHVSRRALLNRDRCETRHWCSFPTTVRVFSMTTNILLMQNEGKLKIRGVLCQLHSSHISEVIWESTNRVFLEKILLILAEKRNQSNSTSRTVVFFLTKQILKLKISLTKHWFTTGRYFCDFMLAQG